MIEIGLRDPVQWRVATRWHDWLAGPALATFLGAWTADGLIGRPDRFIAGDEDEPWSLGENESLVDAILRIPRDGGGGLSCELNGEAPRPWRMSIVLSRWESDLRRTRGYSMINLNLPRKYCEQVDSRLLDLFETLHRPDNCEYASIHPEHHGEMLRMGPYVPALTIGPMFAGLLWANFLGPGIVDSFDRETINRLEVARRRWFNSQGVFLAVTEHLGPIDSPACEKKLIALTDIMRAALV